MRASPLGFIRQQGFLTPAPHVSLFSALRFQPKIIGLVVGIGTVWQAPWVFLALSAVLAWGALVPTRNLFEAIYNRTIAVKRGLPPLTAAPAPRRFAQSLAALLAALIGGALLSGAMVMAWVNEALLSAAVLSILLLNFCPGSWLYHQIAGVAGRTDAQSAPRVVLRTRTARRSSR